jgi:predicted RNase H-like HicB family nuclease
MDEKLKKSSEEDDNLETKDEIEEMVDELLEMLMGTFGEDGSSLKEEESTTRTEEETS